MSGYASLLCWVAVCTALQKAQPATTNGGHHTAYKYVMKLRFLHEWCGLPWPVVICPVAPPGHLQQLQATGYLAPQGQPT